MEDKYLQYRDTIDRIERDIRNNDVSYRDLSAAIENLRSIIKEIQDDTEEDGKEYLAVMTSVDKELAIQGEKIANVYYQLDQLDKRVSALESDSSAGSDKEKEAMSKVLMLMLAALATQIVNALQK